MLPKINRLTKREDFDLVKKNGRRIQGKYFGVLIDGNKENSSRFGFIVSSKISREATERNKMKRVLREAVRKNLPNLKPGYDVIFLGRKELLGRPFLEIVCEIERIFTNL